MDTTRVHPHDHDDTLDAHYSGPEAPHGTPHGCYSGPVFIGHMIEEDGEEVEIVEAVPCRRCASES